MLLVVCLNPAVDVTYHVAALVPGHSHRVSAVTRRAGGKGTNVVRVLAQLGERPTLTGFVGGASGGFVADELHAAGIDFRFVETDGDTRTSVTVVADGDATVFNEAGPKIAEAEWTRLVDQFRLLARDAEVTAICGSRPPGLADDVYAELVRLGQSVGSRVLVDADGEPLRLAVAAGPAVVKINEHEAGGLLGHDIAGEAAAEAAARELADRTEGLVVVTRGAHGFVAADEDGQIWRVRHSAALAGNPTGAGDAMTAALARGLAHAHGQSDVFAEAAAVSAAAVVVAHAGEIDPDTRDRMRPLVQVEHVLPPTEGD